MQNVIDLACVQCLVSEALPFIVVRVRPYIIVHEHVHCFGVCCGQAGFQIFELSNPDKELDELKAEKLSIFVVCLIFQFVIASNKKPIQMRQSTMTIQDLVLSDIYNEVSSGYRWKFALRSQTDKRVLYYREILLDDFLYRIQFLLIFDESVAFPVPEVMLQGIGARLWRICVPRLKYATYFIEDPLINCFINVFREFWNCFFSEIDNARIDV